MCARCAADAAPPDAALPLGAFCDDGNPCTVDRLDGAGCRFDPVSEGALCDDGDLCTLGDECRAGECVAGARAEGELARLGTLDNLAGRRVPLGPGRFAVVTIEDLFRGRVQVVAPSEDGLATLASWGGELTFVILGDDEILADAFGDTGLVAVSAVGERSLRFFAASDAEVVPRGQLEIDNQIVSLDGRADRLWLCTGNFVVGYQVTLVDVSDPDAPSEVGSMPLGPVGCGSVAINQDGGRVYVNTVDGVRFIDASPLDTGGDPTLSDVIAPPAGVAVSGSHLLLMTAAAVRILDEPSLDELVSVPVAGARAATLFGDRLLVEGNRPVAGDSEVFVAWYDVFGAGTPTLLDDTVTATFIGVGQAPSFRSATDGATLLTGSRLFDLTSDRLDERRVPQLVPLRSIAPAGSGLRAYHPAGAAAIDASDPANPSFVTGGDFPAARPILTVALDDSLATPTLVTALGRVFGDSTRVPVDPSNPYFPNPLRIERWTLDASADLVAADHFQLLHEGSSQLLTAGDFLFRYRRPDGAPATWFQAYWLPAARAGATAAPIFELPIPASTTFPRGFDVDPRARLAVLSTEAVSTSGDPEPALLVYDLSTSPPTLVDHIPTDTLYSQLGIAGDRLVAVNSDAVVFLERGQGELARLPLEAFQIQLLAFDGAVAYLSYLEIVPGTATYSLAAIPFADPASRATIEVNSIARSLVPVDGGLAVGFDTQLVTVHPHCP